MTEEKWRAVWRAGVAPLLSTPALKALKEALASDDSRLIQGATTTPPPLVCVMDWPATGACVLGFCGMADGKGTVGEIEEFFSHLCYEIDDRMMERAACRWFLNWFDETPRDKMRAALLPEVQRSLRLREEMKHELPA